MISIRSKAALILFSGLMMSSAINANEINITNSNIIFEDKTAWKDCENGFENPKTKAGKMTKSIQDQVDFDPDKNWGISVEGCTYATLNNHKYMIRSLYLLKGQSALYVVFKDNRAFGIYGDYGPNGEWFYRKGKVGTNTAVMEEILNSYLIREEWVE